MSPETRIHAAIIERNFAHFARRLRKAGIKVGTGHVIEMLHALDVVGMSRCPPRFSQELLQLP